MIGGKTGRCVDDDDVDSQAVLRATNSLALRAVRVEDEKKPKIPNLGQQWSGAGVLVGYRFLSNGAQCIHIYDKIPVGSLVLVW